MYGDASTNFNRNQSIYLTLMFMLILFNMHATYQFDLLVGDTHHNSVDGRDTRQFAIF